MEPPTDKTGDGVAPEDLAAHFSRQGSHRLESRHGKMVCPRCGFFMCCSQFE